MQTFLPYRDYKKSVALLDMKRLGKQRVENYQMLMSLTVGGGLHGGWTKHPASRMWKYFELSLLEYQEATVKEWVSRGYNDTCWEKSWNLFTPEQQEAYLNHDYPDPHWLTEDLRLTHRQSLLLKAPEFYGPIFLPDEPDLEAKMEYIWTMSKEEAEAIEKAEFQQKRNFSKSGTKINRQIGFTKL